VWAWFGGTPDAQDATVSQTLYIPSGQAHISFYLWIGRHSGNRANDYLRVKLDGTLIFQATDADTQYDTGYILVQIPTINETSSGIHLLEFVEHNDARNSPIDFNVDDVSLTVSGACQPACPSAFTDVPPSNAFYQYVECLACQQIIGGYPDNTFRPSNNITRGQAAKILSNAAGYSDPIPQSQQTFHDVAPGSTFWVYIERVYAHGAINGYACGGVGESCDPQNRPYFRAGNNLTRGQLAKIDSSVRGYNDPIPQSQQTFHDVAPGSTFWVYIERVYAHGVISGYACGGVGEPCDPQHRPYFRGGNNVTRGQTSKIIGISFFPGCTP
jgi:hypothetical protein